MAIEKISIGIIRKVILDIDDSGEIDPDMERNVDMLILEMVRKQKKANAKESNERRDN
jgi:hypothetical protein